MTKLTRIIFMGTPEFAVPTLRALYEQSAANNWQIVGVVTQPDRPAGRGNKVIFSPVKTYAVAQDLPLLQPANLRKEPAMVEALRALEPDLFVVAAFGQILRQEVLDIPPHGSINVHASILPAYRGASPITAALLNGDRETGNSIMLMDAGMDTGPVLVQAKTAIQPDDTTATLTERLATEGAQLLVATLPQWLAEGITPTQQDALPGEVSICRMIKRSAGQIDWQQSAEQIERMTRAYAPWPSAYTTWQGQNFKIWRASVLPDVAEPGLVVATAAGVAVGTGDGLLQLETVQPAGKRQMEVRNFLNGAPDFIGSQLGNA